LIDDHTLPVITSGGRYGALADLVKALNRVPFAGTIAKRLQPYLVQVPFAVRARLIASRAAEVIRKEDFGEQFVLLQNGDLYDERTGLNWDEPEMLNMDSTIF